MTKIIKSKYKASRRLGTAIWGDNKDAFHVRNFRPGQHGANNKGKTSDYGTHLQAKQILKNHYGRVTEKQFSNLFKLAAKMKGNTAENFAGLLESRLDMIVYRMNLAPTIFAARQLVSHANILLNGKKVNIPSIKLKAGDKIELKEKAKKIALYQEAAQKQERTVPAYLTVDAGSMSGEYVRIAAISDIPYPFEPNFGKIVEYYSK